MFEAWAVAIRPGQGIMKMKKKNYLPKYPLASEEFSSTDLFGMVDKIVNHEERSAFYTKIIPVSIVVTIIIMYFILR